MCTFRHLLTRTVLLLFIVSCSSEADKTLSTYTVTRKNFENSLSISGFVDPVNVTSVNCPMFIDGLVEWLVEEGTYVEEGDTLCVIDFLALETRYDQVLTSLEAAKTGLNRTVADLSMQYALLEAQVKSNEAESTIAKMDSLQLLYSPANQRKIKELELEKSLISKARYEKKLAALKIIQQSEIRRREIEVQQWTAQAKQAEEQLSALTIKAPKAGLVVLPLSWYTGQKLKVGDNVWSNHPIATLPEMGRMKVKMMASESDYRQINMNDSVWYHFDAMPENQGFGKIVNRAYQGQPVQRDSQVKTFEIEGSIDSVAVMPDPGFTADCHIVLKEMSDMLVIPQIALFDQDSTKVVFVRSKRGYEMRQVKPGLASANESVIEEGLDEGEVISLSRPSERAIRRRTLLPLKDSVATGEVPVPADSLKID